MCLNWLIRIKITASEVIEWSQFDLPLLLISQATGNQKATFCSNIPCVARVLSGLRKDFLTMSLFLSTRRSPSDMNEILGMKHNLV